MAGQVSAAEVAVEAPGGADAAPGLLFVHGRLRPGGGEAYQRYLEGTGPLLEKYGATVTADGSGVVSTHAREAWPINTLLTFPDVASAEAFLADREYLAIKTRFRDRAYETLHLTLVAGRAPRVAEVGGTSSEEGGTSSEEGGTSSEVGGTSIGVVGGLYELGVGTEDPLGTLEYLQQYGYRIAERGRLEAADARRLYGVDSGVESLRLAHGEADHGLYRLMVWDDPRDQGLGLAGMKVIGGRWGAAVTSDVYAIVNHAEDAVRRGLPVHFVEPQRQTIYAAGEGRPFLDPVACVREMLLIRPETRQILFQRYGYRLALYGAIEESASLRTSQVTHAGLVLQGGPELTEFYEHALGLLRARDGHVSDDSDRASKNIFELLPGERYATTDFDDPRSVLSDLQKVRSGRLKIVRFLPEGPPLENLLHRSRPGSLGLSLYTYRVGDLEALRPRLEEHGARDLTPVISNEFGEPSLSFVAPDGYFWTLVASSP